MVYYYVNNGSSSSFAVLLVTRHCCFLTAKMGTDGRTVVNALNKWLVTIFWKTSEASNSQIFSMVVLKTVYIVTGNDVIGYFRSATDRANATGAIANFSVRKYFFPIISENATASSYNYSRCNMRRRDSYCSTNWWAFWYFTLLLILS